ncbi:MAG: PhzF family phenazine biosynthesis protein [Planctomycetes bacterium]|nr:PhzF family phenazine biosynthesis protein [Planctomycetota bacterium]
MHSIEFPFYQIDAFTDRAFAGNPAAVCIVDIDEFMNAGLLQSIAKENNLAETAFLRKNGDRYDIRWFSPRCEVELCGHATLASACALWKFKHCESDSIQFSSASGMLSAKRDGEMIVLDFPRIDNAITMTPGNLAEAIGTTPFAVCKAGPDLLIEVGDADCVRHADINIPILAQIETERGIIICAEHDQDDYDIICRFFAPQAGIPEDHVTGSAHCALGPYWAKRLKKNSLRSFQASPRGGSIDLLVTDQRVELRGQAHCVVAGTYYI